MLTLVHIITHYVTYR